MSRKLVIVMVALFAAVAFAASLALAAEAPKKITIDKIKDATKGYVTFDHEVHAKDFKCVECHHEAKTEADQKNIKSCFECHGKDAKADAKGSIKSKKKDNPFHKNCIACHKEKDKGPKKCKECHGGADEE